MMPHAAGRTEIRLQVTAAGRQGCSEFKEAAPVPAPLPTPHHLDIAAKPVLEGSFQRNIPAITPTLGLC
jgi:hypothetical protein